MAQAANIVLADAQATPVNKTFSPIGPDPKDPGKFWFEDQSSTSAIGFWKICVQIKRPAPASDGTSSSGRSARVFLSLHEPVMEILGNNDAGILASPTLAYTPRCYIEFVLPERSTILDRRNIRKMAALLIADPQVLAMVETYQTIW